MTEPASKKLIRHLHAFRGFAIINVVAIHAWRDEVFRFGADGAGAVAFRLYIVNEALFHGSTIYFALISGLLFSLVLRDRPWLTFFRTRAVAVVSPYIFMTLLFTLYGHDESHRLAPFAGSVSDYAAAVVTNLLTGGAFYHFWYIPILVALYLATPLVAWFSDRPKARWLVLLVVAAPLVTSRTSDDVSWSSVVYYLGAYTAGMLIGTHYEVALRLFRRYSGALLIIAAVSTYAVLQTYLRNVEWIGFVSIRESLFYIQKLSLAALVIAFLHRYKERLPQLLMTVATNAFPIYFLHAFIVIVLGEAQQALGLAPAEDNAAGMILGGAALLVGSIAASVALSRLLQGVLGSRTRALIGA